MESLLTRLRPLAEPLHVAGIVAWFAIYAALLREAPEGSGVVKTWQLAGALVFFGLFLVGMLGVGRTTRGLMTLTVLQTLIALALCALAPASVVPVLMIIVMVQFASRLGPRPLLAVGIVLNATLYTIFALLWRDPAWLLILIYGSFQAFAGLVAWYARRAEAAAEELRQVNAHLLATRSLLEETARDQERLALARELHDVAGHKLTALKLNLTLLQRAPESAASLPACAKLADELLHDIRAVVAQLRQHDGMDLRRALEELAAAWPRPRVHLTVAADARVGDVARAQAILRAVQESITNAARHADATNVWIDLVRDGDSLRLAVRDDGRGASALVVGNGLAGMRERIEAVGGALTIDAASGAGFRLEASLPLAPA